MKFHLTPIIIYEPPELSELLRNGRISDYPWRIFQKLRMEHMLSPIFTEEHRQKIILRNQNL